MQYDEKLIGITTALRDYSDQYSVTLLHASGLQIALGDVRCYLDGYYLLCLSEDDRLRVIGGKHEAVALRFHPFFYNVNLSHTVIGSPLYAEMRSIYGYPDFHLFRDRDEHFFGLLRLTEAEYTLAKQAFAQAGSHIASHATNEMWSCHTRSDMITILRIAEGAYLGAEGAEGNPVLRFIREHVGEELTLDGLCREFHTNRTTLTAQIRELTGLPPMRFVQEERLNQSRPDLLFTQVPIADIAAKYGYADVSYYIRAFKTRFGCSPLQYRKEGWAERIRNEKRYHFEGDGRIPFEPEEEKN